MEKYTEYTAQTNWRADQLAITQTLYNNIALIYMLQLDIRKLVLMLADCSANLQKMVDKKNMPKIVCCKFANLQNICRKPKFSK